MTNEEKYKTPEERKLMFDCFCNTRLCVFCQCNADVIGKTKSERDSECKPKWLALEADEEEKKKHTQPSTTCVVVETTLTKGGKPIATWSRKAN